MGFDIEIDTNSLKSVYCPFCRKQLVSLNTKTAHSAIKCKCGRYMILKGQNNMFMVAVCMNGQELLPDIDEEEYTERPRKMRA